MKAVGFLKSLPIEAEDSLFDVEMPVPEMRPADLLVAVEAISVNPADAKRRIRARKLTGLDIIATASRPESAERCKKMGAHDIVDHRELVAGFRNAGT